MKFLGINCNQKYFVSTLGIDLSAPGPIGGGSSGIDFGSSGHGGSPSTQYGPPGKSGPY